MNIQQKKRRVAIDLTPEQYDLIEKYANRYGLSIGPYIRTNALDHVRKFDELKTNSQLLDKLKKIDFLTYGSI